jgi:hypothetical protein
MTRNKMTCVILSRKSSTPNGNNALTYARRRRRKQELSTLSAFSQPVQLSVYQDYLSVNALAPV